jgi:hypothetical protein
MTLYSLYFRQTVRAIPTAIGLWITYSLQILIRFNELIARAGDIR